MSQNLVTQESAYKEALDALQDSAYSNDPKWIHNLREEALEKFLEMGFPISRRNNEEWKYTNIGPIASHPFQVATSLPDSALAQKSLNQFDFGSSDWTRLVFLDGYYSEQLSSLSGISTGINIVNLSEEFQKHPDAIDHQLAQQAEYNTNAFTALNTAFIHDGSLIEIPDNTTLEHPVHLLYLSTTEKQDSVSHPRSLIKIGENSAVAIVETYEYLYASKYFTNSVTEVTLGTGATVEYYKMQRQSEQAFHITNTYVSVGRDSSFSSVNIDLGGNLVRNNLNVLMNGTGGYCSLNGLYLTENSQHVDNQVIIDHAEPHTTSNELYKGILNDKSRTVFHGSIIVRKDAQKVDARQEDRNLLLSDQAEADTKPAFWIYADDVRCAHGAACGHIDETSLFYLRCRGIDEQTARNLLIRGFVTEVIDSIRNDSVRSRVDELVQQKLADWLGKS